LGPAGITSANRSCPVGAPGRCKHIAALFLAWVDAPDSFKETDDLTASLEKRSKAELIALIGIESGEKTLDTQIIQKQAKHAFHSSHGDWEMGWGDPYEIVEEFQALFDLAGQYQAQNNPGNAATIYRIVYVQAAGYLQPVHEAYLRLGESHTWEMLIVDLREMYRNLPALREELDRAGF
jgi:uncharacterized Zn finger protein